MPEKRTSDRGNLGRKKDSFDQGTRGAVIAIRYVQIIGGSEKMVSNKKTFACKAAGLALMTGLFLTMNVGAMAQTTTCAEPAATQFNSLYSTYLYWDSQGNNPVYAPLVAADYLNAANSLDACCVGDTEADADCLCHSPDVVSLATPGC